MPGRRALYACLLRFATAEFKLAAIFPINSDLGLGRSYVLVRNIIRPLSWLSALHSEPMVGPGT